MKVDCEYAGALVEATNGMVCGKKNDQCCCSASRDPHKKLRTVKSDPFEIETTNVRSVELKHLWDTSEVLPEQ